MKHFILSVDEINKLQMENEAYKQSEQEASEIISELKAELQKYKDMEAKGLEEFKDVGGCWGCGLQLQLNQDLEDIKQLKAENDKLKECNKELISDNLNTIQEMDNERRRVEQLKEEVETRDNLIDHFRDEALYRATIASEYQKDRTKLEQTLQEIKVIVCGNYEIIDPQGRKDILKLITKAEEE